LTVAIFREQKDQLARDHEGAGCGERDSPSPLNFSSKNAGFYAFLCEKLLVARNWEQQGLIDPLGYFTSH